MLVSMKLTRATMRAGDIFAFQLCCEAGLYRYGRIIFTDVTFGAFDKSILVYTFSHISKNIHDLPSLKARNFLLPPIVINRLPWSRGYFVNVERRELGDREVLDEHVFSDPRGWFFDLSGKRVAAPSRSDNVGHFGLHSYSSFALVLYNTLGYETDNER